MKTVDRSNDVATRPCVWWMREVLRDLLVELLEHLSLHGSRNVLFLHSNVADSKNHVAAEALNGEEAAFLELMIEA